MTDLHSDDLRTRALAILARGRSLGTAARLSGVSVSTIRHWKAGGQRRLRGSDLLPPPAGAPLHVVVERIRAEAAGAEPSAGMLLKLTAPYVLHPEASLEHFTAWLKFAVKEMS